MATPAQAVPPPLPVWVPSGRLARPHPCGESFDAVGVGYFEGICAIGRLGLASAAVIEDAEAGRITWLVTPGSADGWDLPDVVVLGQGRRIYIPPLDPPDTATLRWAIRPDADFLTCPRALYRALVHVTGGRPDARILSTYTSPECAMAEHEVCSKGEVRSTPPDTGVVEEPCVCTCHSTGAGR
ncbi:hypothetical protein [Streptomyces sp. NBC_01803]|uniref:hypothetical protein n=1 Tax=Streptomyces sp. NBC_01803 TaxID=2975946 RepID=UPI002DDADBE1|nr:hypothetical protein [Streptomyces sp. NBC_01803]WSA44974.1 hypothetical protein OIE51_12590 [Streptomyces sp. NBC_01803]